MIRMYIYGGILAALALAFGLFGWRMHSRGWDAATAHYKAVVDAALAANASQARTIAELQTANQQWADAMKGNAQKLSQAVAQLKVTQADDAKALAAAQAKLRKAEAEHGDAHAWSVTPVPDSVLDVLRADGVHQADRPH